MFSQKQFAIKIPALILGHISYSTAEDVMPYHADGDMLDAMVYNLVPIFLLTMFISSKRGRYRTSTGSNHVDDIFIFLPFIMGPPLNLSFWTLLDFPLYFRMPLLAWSLTASAIFLFLRYKLKHTIYQPIETKIRKHLYFVLFLHVYFLLQASIILAFAFFYNPHIEVNKESMHLWWWVIIPP